MRHEKRENRRNTRAGFTLIEMLAVITIIALLIGAVVGSAFLIIHSARVSRYNATGATLEVAINAYRTEYGQWPIPPSPTPSITPGGSWSVSNSNWQVFDLLQTGNTAANANTHGIHFLDYNSIFTQANGQRISLFQCQQQNNGTLPARNPLVYITSAGQTAYFTVSFDFSTDTVTVSPPHPAVTRDDGF